MLFESTLESETSVFYKTKSPAYFHTLSIFGGRGWITQAALLKTAHWAVFAPSSATGPQLFESTRMKTQIFYKQKTASVSLRRRSFYGRGWIRTTEAEKQQIYSLSPLATREHAQILFTSVAGRLVYFIRLRAICQLLFSDFCSFSAETVGRVSFGSDVSGARNPARRQWLRRTWGIGQ